MVNTSNLHFIVTIKCISRHNSMMNGKVSQQKDGSNDTPKYISEFRVGVSLLQIQFILIFVKRETI